VHMLLISWAGEQAQKDLMASIRRDIKEETTRAVTKLRYHGHRRVSHGSVYLSRVFIQSSYLHNSTRRIMLEMSLPSNDFVEPSYRY
jgi:predicted AlkP superfamily pyrophosphatase or phosphodiesterase